MITNLSQRAMLVSLNISVWTARKYDARVSRQVAAQHNVSKDTGAYYKDLIDRTGSYRDIQKLVSEARTYHYTHTLPWTNEGARILPSANYMDYADGLRDLRTRFDVAKRAFIAEYPQLRTDAQRLLNGLWQAEDYPTAVADRFSFDVRILPLPDAADFRVELADGEVDLIRQQITDEVQSATSVAMRDLWDRLYKAVSHMTERLSDPDAVFRDSLVSNLHELCSILPKINLTNDSELERLRRQVESELLKYEADDLREDDTVRADVAAKAQAIQDAMAAYMGR